MPSALIVMLTVLHSQQLGPVLDPPRLLQLVKGGLQKGDVCTTP